MNHSRVSFEESAAQAGLKYGVTEIVTGGRRGKI
jgi:hypothetical protein